MTTLLPAQRCITRSMGLRGAFRQAHHERMEPVYAGRGPPRKRWVSVEGSRRPEANGPKCGMLFPPVDFVSCRSVPRSDTPGPCWRFQVKRAT